ncbi:MAG: ABC transporter permease [Bacteroidales bacterium]|jgi:putative ABC transport system permease protein|nr:ABC transporter permease [Bacteroidales bacterium]
MILRYIKQAWAHLRQEPLVGSITIVGTAIAIFLIMLVVMLQQVKYEPFPPESNRGRMLHAKYISTKTKKWTVSGPMDKKTAETLYKSLKTPERVTLYSCDVSQTAVSSPESKKSFVADLLKTDADFWKIFDFDFIHGKPFDSVSFASGLHKAVISEGISRRLFGTDDAEGYEINLNHSIYTVSGVVKTVSTLATTAYAQIWIPYTSTNYKNEEEAEQFSGPFSVAILAKNRKDFPAIRKECKAKAATLSNLLDKRGITLITCNRPYDQKKEYLATDYSNKEAELWPVYKRQILIFLILLFVPAINLGSMAHGRLRRRTVEIGIRRAFGCTRRKIITDIITENFITTLIAGILGLALTVAFAYLGADLLFSQPYSETFNLPTVNLSIIMHKSTFAAAIIFCFILNFLFSYIPARAASRTAIVNALEGKR